MDMKLDIIQIMDSIGIYIEPTEDDIDLTEYILDSIQFISFIVEVENRFAINYPDDMLMYDCLKSINSFAIKIDEMIKQKKLQS